MTRAIMSRVDDPHVSRDETVITRKRLAELEAKERAHDDYMTATRLMGQRVRGMHMESDGDDYYIGYTGCLRDFCQLVVDQGRMRDALS